MKARVTRVFLMASALSVSGAVASAAPIVLANNPAPGDAYTNAGGTNQGQAVGASGWFYNNVRNGGVVGISTALPRSGNGSVSFSGNNGPGGSSYKADIEYLAGGTDVGGNYFATSTLGAFSAFEGMAYDWYRDASSTNSNVQMPSLRILLDLDGNLATTGDRGGLVYERAYNEAGAAPTNQWVSAVIGSSTKLWNFGLGLGNEFDIDSDGTPYDTLAEWQASARLANAVILGFSSGVGSGWGPYSGAVDNIAWTINGATTSTNFEVAAVPEPATLMLLGIAVVGAARRRRS